LGLALLKTVAATALFGLVHSALASRQAKELAAATLGRRRRNAFYRLFYIGQSFVTLAALAAYLRRLPDRMLYHVRGWPAALLRLGQGASLFYAVAAAYHVGLTRITGLASAAAWLRGTGEVPPEPEAQGPALSAAGAMRASGPFVWSRHPLNLAPVPIFWLWPRMTLKLAVFNLVCTLYLVLGSLHEEARLRAAYGLPYDRYCTSGVPFYVPLLAARSTPDLSRLSLAPDGR
jgi:protein-S-isoprenylcysteine O-methyltransferase Ste14